MRKVLSYLLSLVMVLTLALPAAAAEENGGDTAAQPSVPAPTQCAHNWTVESTSNPTCTTEGSTVSKCSLCGATNTVTTPAAGHTLGGWIHVDAGMHKRVCTCGYEETAAHTLSETPITAATCVSAGKSTFSCPCGYSFEKEYAATGIHTYTDWSATVQTHSRSCTVCQHAENGSHVFTERVDLPASCKEPGIIAEYCPTCDYIVYETIPQLTTHTYDNACDPDCNICGVTREVEHQYQQWRTKGVTGHWYACSVCGDKGSFEKHYPGPAATEEKDQICLTCGYVMTPKLNHQHEYSKSWTSDEEGHWYACSGCEEQKDFAGHVYDDACDADCNICGYKTGNAHSFDGTWHSDDEGHWFVCSVCCRVAESQTHTPPETVNPGEAQFCTGCGYKIAEASIHVHEFAEDWKRDELSHWKECACGETSEISDHSWESVRDDGVQVIHTCVACGAEYTEQIPEDDKGDFPWGIVLIVLTLLIAAAVAALIRTLRPRKKRRSKR